MYQELEQYIKSHGEIGEKELQQIIKSFKPIKTTRNEMLCNIGQVCKHFYFIKKGCLKLYEIDNKGNEVTGYFALEDSIISANTSFILQKPSRDCLVSLEPSELLIIYRDDFFKLVNTVPQFANVYHKFIEFAFIHSQMRIYSFLGMEGIDKLKWVMEHEPKLLSRISSKAVASYLGMTNSTLSKLRAKL
ncbi:Crp/Fnr family transcriptional regulator [Flavivirga amylovorans]|uniref:Crp/Fnr family transcriptional regulator n=1 Tax=Flavivirga amylovorans TaxID=870486 RepID=A0ABT8WZE7_9FLAO|nr:Crp/Fnr family transcriptional regulator [Flavivirga amylovorans]MDO5986872.1 Crp/Fnr family transcriptional regulator [Flavivirga amylovorans]